MEGVNRVSAGAMQGCLSVNRQGPSIVHTGLAGFRW